MTVYAVEDVFAALAAQFGDRASRAASVVAAHGASESYHAAHPPDIVVFPQSTDEVAPDKPEAMLISRRNARRAN